MHARMDRLDGNQLKALLETVETGSLSAAARRLGLTRPTLSWQAAAIEQQLGVTLFERVGKAMALSGLRRREADVALRHVRRRPGGPLAGW